MNFFYFILLSKINQNLRSPENFAQLRLLKD